MTNLPTPEEVDALAPEHLPALVAALAALQARAAARLMSLAPTNGGRGDHTLDVDETIVGVEEAARIAHHSVSWMRKNGHTLPGFRQPRGRGTAVGWAKAELTAWAKRA